MSVYQGDFLGFALGNEHSYGLNITRVSTNDRYQDTLLPAFTDATAQVPGGDGTYYWDTNYTQKPISVDFAFDDLRDEDLRRLRQMFSYKGIKPIIFDEFPYKKYMVKCAQPPQLKYLCFDYQDIRVYKGEGNVQFIAYYPFALATISPKCAYSDDGAIINNNGDLPAFLEIKYLLSALNNSLTLTLSDVDDNMFGQLKLKSITPFSGDEYILINGRTQLIEGLDSEGNKTGHLYNKYITDGDFFCAPLGKSILTSNIEFQSANYTPLFF